MEAIHISKDRYTSLYSLIETWVEHLPEFLDDEDGQYVGGMEPIKKETTKRVKQILDCIGYSV